VQLPLPDFISEVPAGKISQEKEMKATQTGKIN
jgi:hypothetical protein